MADNQERALTGAIARLIGLRIHYQAWTAVKRDGPYLTIDPRVEMNIMDQILSLLTTCSPKGKHNPQFKQLIVTMGCFPDEPNWAMPLALVELAKTQALDQVRWFIDQLTGKLSPMKGQLETEAKSFSATAEYLGVPIKTINHWHKYGFVRQDAAKRLWKSIKENVDEQWLSAYPSLPMVPVELRMPRQYRRTKSA